MNADDADLLDGLRRMWEARDPVPPTLADEVLLRLAPELDDDAELLALLADADLLAGVRGSATGTRTFAGDGIDLLVAVALLQDGRRRIDGWIAPAAAGSVVVAVAGTRTAASVGANGRFELTGLPAGDAVLDLAVHEAAGGLRRVRTPPFPI